VVHHPSPHNQSLLLLPPSKKKGQWRRQLSQSQVLRKA